MDVELWADEGAAVARVAEAAVSGQAASEVAGGDLQAREPLRAFMWRFRFNYLFGAFNGMTWLIALGAPMVLLAEALGATPAQVNLCYNFVFLLLPVQVLATALTPYLGFKKQMQAAWGARVLCLLVPLGIAVVGPATPAPAWMLWALIASVFMFSLLRSLGSPVVLPWLQAILPEGQRGRYFTTDQSVTALVGVGILLLCAGMAEWMRGSYEAFAWQYALAVLGGVGAWFCLRQWPDAPKPKMMRPQLIFSELPRAVRQDKPVRQILYLSVAQGIMGSSFIPLTTYYLKVEAGLTMSAILVYSALQYTGVIAGSWALRNLLDRFGSRPFFQLSLLVGVCLDIFWLSLVLTQSALLLALVPLAYIGLGVGLSPAQAAMTRYLAQIGNYENRCVLIAGITATAGVGNALFAYIWGLTVQGDSEGQVGLDMQRFAFYFAFGIAVRWALFYAFRFLQEERPGAALRFSNAGLIRPIRYFASMINLVEPERPKKRGTKGLKDRHDVEGPRRD
ncbi:MAG: MFS transporter [Opitutales bacterium]